MRRLIDCSINFKYAFRPHKPLLLFRLAKAVIKSYLFNIVPLRYVDFALDFKCNLKCAHCFTVSLEQDGRRKLTIGEYRDIARQSMELGTVNFSFQGGEPLLFDKLLEIINVFQPERNLISVTTNGTLLTKNRVTELKRVGVDILTISLDSSIAKEHDNFRGVPGSFDKAFKGIKFALEGGINVTLGCVVTHENLKSKGILGLIEFSQKSKLLLYLIFPVPAGRWSNQKFMLLTHEDLLFIKDIIRRFPYTRTDFQANLGKYGCGAVKEILYITPYGDVLPCPFLHLSLGNVFEEPLSDIRNRGLKNKYFASYYDKCLASTDRDFIEKYLSKTFTAQRLPLQWSEVFGGKD